MGMRADAPEIEELERAAAWRLRLLDDDLTDAASAQAARLLEHLAEDLRHHDYAPLWTELRSISHWLEESDAITDYVDLALDYRARIGISAHPADGAAYLQGLLAIARSLV
jgi:hypothetical protein